MRRYTSLFVLFCMLGSSAFAAGINVSSTRGFTTTLEIDCPKVDLGETQVLGAKAITVTAPEAGLSFEKDAPVLPRYTAMVMVDPAKRPVFQVTSLQSEVVELDARVVPSKGNFSREISPDSVPFNFGEVYGKDAWYPSDDDMVTMGEPFIFREIRGVNLVVNPVQYNPAQNKIRVHRKLQVSVRSDDQPSKNVITKSAPISKVFEPIYKNTFVNFDQAAKRLPRLDEQGRLLIICFDEFMDAMKPFVDWKKKIGIDVKMVPVSEAGKTNDEIKAFIQDEFNQGGLTNIMLVGDSAQIPTNKGVKERADSDPCYTKLAGDDHVPDAIISRLSAENKDQVAYQVAKFVSYEQFPTADTAWYSKGVGIASAEGNPADKVYMEENRVALLGAMFKHVDQIYDPSAPKAKVTEAVNEGRSLINYLGHGSSTSWGTTYFNNTDASNLSNGWKQPIIFDVACVNGKFVNFTCFGEAWMRSGNIEKPAGAVTYMGSSTNMQWVPPIKVQEEFNKESIAKEVYKTVGGIFTNGIIKGLEIYGTTSSGSGVMMYEQWHIFGDSTLLCRFKAPVKIGSDAKAVRNDDNVTVTVNVVDEAGNAISNARVTVYTEGVENVKVATTNDNGEAVVTMPKEMTEGYVTVIGADVIPVVDQKISF
ncbi:MAG: C25 family cysteine peptidase [Candidatus Rifleibacteriota bacterium]